MARETLRDIVSRLTTSTTALAALGATLAARTTDRHLPAELQPRVDEVVAALGVEALDVIDPVELRAMLAQLRTFTLTSSKLLFASSTCRGWDHTERELLEAAGDVSAAFPQALARVIAPQLEGLEPRLSAPGAAFLDVGVGVAALSVEMARLWPSLRVVGIDPSASALAIARERVRAALLDHRVELREQRAEELTDMASFDLAWIPSAFVPERAIAEVVRRVHLAIRPGGWLLVPTLKASSDPLLGSVQRLNIALFGGLVTTPDEVERLLREQGLADVRTLPGSPTAFDGRGCRAPAGAGAAVWLAQSTGGETGHGRHHDAACGPRCTQTRSDEGVDSGRGGLRAIRRLTSGRRGSRTTPCNERTTRRATPSHPPPRAKSHRGGGSERQEV